MNGFLILSSLGLVFYLVLLLALYRDGRKRRVMSGGPVRKLTAGSVSEFSVRTSQADAIAALKRNSPEDVLWVPLTRNHWTPALRTTRSNRVEPVYLADPVAIKDDRQCG
jgi:hypothetical protein